MGMSGDFESAVSGDGTAVLPRVPIQPSISLADMHLIGTARQIEMGSTNVRVGSTIFGARDYSKKN
jgi:uncharacterized pyridoxal phosphate-containing UPF0001 family protein